MYYVNIEFQGKYTIPEEPSPKPSSNGADHYITHWEKGIIGGHIYLKLHRGLLELLSLTLCRGTLEVIEIHLVI